MVEPVRTMVVWCPDWPVVAAVREAGPADDAGLAGGDGGGDEHRPVAVVAAGRVYACSAPARAEGVRRGQRRRDAQARCPELVVVAHDPAREVRAFEPVVDAVEALAPGVEVVAPGVCAVAARGPASYFGGEAAAAELIVDRIAEHCEVEAQIGVADGMFAARLAARDGLLVGPGGSAGYLAGQDVRVLGRPELVGLLRRLGIRTLGAFAALPAGDVLARFGFDGALAHRLAGGGQRRGLAPRDVPADLAVAAEYDPPLERVDAAAFAARVLAERLHEGLGRHGLAATRLVVEATTGAGVSWCRTWRHDGGLDAAAVADRVRWQLEGWLTGGTADGTGIARLALAPDGVVASGGPQLALWGRRTDERDAAHRSATRVQGLLGPDAVLRPVLTGGRSPADRVRLVPWGEDGPADVPDAPWPGALPVPAPAAVPPVPAAATVLDARGAAVGVTGRHAVTAAPATVSVAGGPPVEVLAWAGPWPSDERWWHPPSGPGGHEHRPSGPGGHEHAPAGAGPVPGPARNAAPVPHGARRLARLEVSLADGRALLLAVEGGRWWAEAGFD